MRISYWISDVCSSDLMRASPRPDNRAMRIERGPVSPQQPKVRLFVAADLAAGLAAALSTEQAHYLTRVMRLSDGAAVAVFNGRDGEWSATLRVEGRGRCHVVPESRPRAPASAPDVPDRKSVV